MRRIRVALVLPLLVGLLVACGGDDDDGEETRETIERTTTTVFEIEDVPEDDRDDAILLASLAAVEAWWADVFPEVYGGREFENVSGGFHPYGPGREMPECGDPPLTYELAAGNAFYCIPADLIMWDTDNLTNQLLDQYGEFSLIMVMAHEYAHAAEARVPVVGPGVMFEQQADCFAGAFAASADAGEVDGLELDVMDLAQAMAGFISVRDQIGTPSEDPLAHGSGFDRAGAFQDGFERGPARCAEYEDIFDSGGTTLVEIPFINEADFVSGGNAPFDPSETGNIFDLAIGSLEEFWTAVMPQFFGGSFVGYAPDRVIPYDVDDESTLPDCGDTEADAETYANQAFFCFAVPDDPNDDFVAFDFALMADLYEQIGDFAVATTISKQYSFGVQVQIGNLEDDLPSNLQADCFTGVWAGQLAVDTLQQTGSVALSPGDLDEAIISFLQLAEDLDSTIVGTPFERVSALRDGFFNGIQPCVGYVAG